MTPQARRAALPAVPLPRGSAGDPCWDPSRGSMPGIGHSPAVARWRRRGGREMAAAAPEGARVLPPARFPAHSPAARDLSCAGRGSARAAPGTLTLQSDVNLHVHMLCFFCAGLFFICLGCCWFGFLFGGCCCGFFAGFFLWDFFFPSLYYFFLES